MAIPAIDALNLIKNGPEIHGETNLFSFIEYYDSIFTLNLPATLNPLIIATLKVKLKANAREIVDMNPQCTTWETIRTALISNLSNFASSSTLTDELILIQNDTSTIEFYHKIQQQIVKIINKYRLDNPVAADRQIQDYGATIKRIALKQFRDKLREPLRSILVVRNAESMEAALIILRESSYNLDDAPNKFQNQNKNNNFKKNFRNNSHIENRNNYNNNFQNNNGNGRNNFNRNFRNDSNFGNNFQSNYRNGNSNNFNRGFTNNIPNFRNNNNQNSYQNSFQNNQFQSKNHNSEMSRIRRFGIPEPMDCDQVQNKQNFHFVASNHKDPPQDYRSLD